MAKPMSAKRLAEIREDCAAGRAAFATAHELLLEVERLRALLDGRIDYEQVGAERERKATITWLNHEARAYLTKGREGPDLAQAVARGEHLHAKES